MNKAIKNFIILLSLSLSGCAIEQVKTPSFQGMLIRELQSQISETKNNIARQNERNEHLRQLLADMGSEKSRLHLLVKEKKALLDRMKNNNLSY